VEVPYTREKALELLADPQYADFKLAIEAISKEAAAFRAAEVEAAAKN
jgi:hypothetical protein